MGAHARHAREWFGDFPLQPLRVRSFLLRTLARLASPPRLAGRGGAGPMGAHARHAREWSGDFPLQPLRVRGFLLLLRSFACMEEIALAYLVSNYFCMMASV